MSTLQPLLLKQKRLDYRQRDIMYQMYVGSWQDPKKKPLPIGRYWDIDGSEKKKRDRRMDALAKARAEYLKQKNGGRVKNNHRCGN